MSIVKAFKFPVSVRWYGGRLTRASAPGKHDLDVATPPEFRGGVAGVWSPEDLLVASTASSYAVTLAAVAEKRGVPLHALAVSGEGHVSLRQDGHLGFVAIELAVELETDPEHVRAAEEAAARAEESCLVTMALDVPVDVHVTVRSAPEPALAGR